MTDPVTDIDQKPSLKTYKDLRMQQIIYYRTNIESLNLKWLIQAR